MVKKKVYSYSRLTTFEQCPKQWFYSYIDEIGGETNFYANYGLFAHFLFEAVDKGKIAPSECEGLWRDYYDKRVLDISPEIPPWADKWKADGFWFWQDFDGLEEETVWAEKHFVLDFGGFKFQGHIDRLKVNKDGDFGMVDYKSSKPFKGKDIESKSRQLYLYARAVKEKFGKYPKTLEFWHFRQNKRTLVPFSLKDYNKAVKWAKGVVKDIESEGDWQANPNHFFCRSLCDFRLICPERA